MARTPARSDFSVPNPPPVDVEEFEAFVAHPWIRELGKRIKDDGTRAQYALNRIIRDLGDINKEYVEQHGHTVLVSVEGRVKQADNLLRKLQRECKQASRRGGLTQEVILKLYGRIHDICGVRFACRYFDEVQPIVEGLIRSQLRKLGYGSDLRHRHKDRDFLDR